MRPDWPGPPSSYYEPPDLLADDEMLDDRLYCMHCGDWMPEPEKHVVTDDGEIICYRCDECRRHPHCDECGVCIHSPLKRPEGCTYDLCPSCIRMKYLGSVWNGN